MRWIAMRQDDWLDFIVVDERLHSMHSKLFCGLSCNSTERVGGGYLILMELGYI